MENDISQLSFEQAMQELEQLVGKMESGGLTLDQLVKGFERGHRLADSCRRQLDEFERKITILSHDDGGQGEWQDFAGDEPDQVPASARRSAARTEEELPF